jgi:hypothetical protein
MRYRRLDANGDMTFGRGQGNFWIDQAEAVAQLVLTRLRLNLGEWFADTTDGTAWATEVLGVRTRATRDVVVQARVLGTPGVTDLAQYFSTTDPNARQWIAALSLDTVYGPVALVAAKLPGIVPPLPTAPAAVSQTAAAGLGVLGGTAIGNTPADLTQGPQADVTDFQIQTLAAGSY